jgi:hypothetical protein
MKHCHLIWALITSTSLTAAARETPLLGASSRPSAPAQATVAAEPPAALDPAPHAARTGMYLHGELGAGYRWLTLNRDDLAVRGAGAGGAMMLGGSIAPNLFFFGELSLVNIVSPTIEASGQSVVAKDASALLVGIGPGVVYYFMPANVSLGASFLLSRASFAQDGVKVAETKMGYGGVARIGKEWWVGPRSSFGLNGQLSLASMKDKGEGPSAVFATSFTLGAAYTY